MPFQALCPIKYFSRSPFKPTPLVKGVRWGPGVPPPNLSPGDAVQEVPVPKATVIRSKSLFCFFFGSRRKVFRDLPFHPPG